MFPREVKAWPDDVLINNANVMRKWLRDHRKRRFVLRPDHLKRTMNQLDVVMAEVKARRLVHKIEL